MTGRGEEGDFWTDNVLYLDLVLFVMCIHFLKIYQTVHL